MRELNLERSHHQVGSGILSLADIESAKQRVDLLEELRVQRALHNSRESFRQVFTLLPSLLHFNHPDLVGYIANAPCGLFQFEPDEMQQTYLTDFTSPPFSAQNEPAFDALYVMGSVGSVTQNQFSDLDLWICYSKPLTSSQLVLLEQKLAKIKAWSKQKEVDLNFYLMNPDEFRLQKYGSEVTAEHSGSAQHYVLLDEFYRSAIRLAGKRILWLHIAEQEQYRYVVDKAICDHVIDPNEWIDFGDFSTLPLGEYFGASLWQLYKGIENPYKSTIKILLLESYAETYPETHLISKQFKQHLLCSQQPYHFDPYLAMLERVTAYLENRGELKRLECLRYCFYVKAMEGQGDAWKYQRLRELASDWGWSEQECLLLENKANWKVKLAMRHQQMLVEQLLQSYRNLINFARRFHMPPSIMPQDTDILMRKLYSVFEELPGKVTLINEKIARNLEEPDVTFIEVVEGSTPIKAGWYLVNHAPLTSYDSTTRYVQYQKSLTQLIAWAYFNGVITANTRLHIVSQNVSLERLRHFITDLRLSFPAKSPEMTDDDLYHPNEIRNLIVAVNLIRDPTNTLGNDQELSQADLFNLSSSQQGIIGSISVIYRNMWNEIITQKFEGSEAILKALKLISNKIYRSSAPPQSVRVFCYSAKLTKELQKFVMDLVNRCISVQMGTISQKHSHTFKLAGKKWQLVFKQGVEIQAIADDEPENSAQEMKVPKQIYNFASEGFLQFFFEDIDSTRFNVYVLDKQNKLEVYADCVGQKEEKIKQINQLSAQPDTADIPFESFNYPQFYQILTQENGVLIVPFQSKQHRDYLKKFG